MSDLLAYCLQMALFLSVSGLDHLFMSLLFVWWIGAWSQSGMQWVFWFYRTKELSPSDSGQLSPAGSSSNPSPPDVSGSPVGTSVENMTFLDPYVPGSRPAESVTRPPHNIAPVGLMNIQQQSSSSFIHQPLPFVSSVGSGHHLSLFSDSGFISSRQPKPSFDQSLPGICCWFCYFISCNAVSHLCRFCLFFSFMYLITIC